MFTLRERLRYRFDNLLARGTLALVGALALLTCASVAVAAAVLFLVDIRPEDGKEPYSIAEAAWLSLTREMDPGNVANDNGWALRAVMFTCTVVGIFILSTLIGVLSNGLEGRIDNLRKGRSRVVERNHTVILGWSEQVFAIVTELIEANASRGGSGACIVILGDKDKVEMDDAIRDKVGDTRGTRIVCRTGSPIEAGDLSIASIDTARSIVIVAADDDDDLDTSDPDVEVIKSLLAITNNAGRKQERYHIVAEIRDPKNFEVAEMVGKDEVELVLVGDLIARIMAQTCRQSGLSVVYQELLDFGGDEIYFTEEKALAGKTYGEATLAYEDCAVMGIRPRAGIPILNPPRDMPINAGDKLIVIAEDDSLIKLKAAPPPDTAAFHVLPDIEHKPERTLILGWNWRAPMVINELDAYVVPGSTVLVVADIHEAEDVLKADCARLSRQTLSFQPGDTTDRRTLDALKVENFDHVIVLCYDNLPAQKADAATLITLLHLRDISAKTKRHISIVSEMLDMNNRALAEVTHADDFIVSDRLVSLLLSQISENKELNIVFKDLFSPEGSEIYLKPASSYVKIGMPMTFSTVIGAAAEKGQTAIGYKIAAFANDAGHSYGVKVNPKKSASITFGPNDRVIVLAEE